MRAVVLGRPGQDHAVGWCGAFGAGLARHGWSVAHSHRPQACDLLVLWGTRDRAAIAAQKAAGGEVCVLERGYLGDRVAWTSVAFGGGLNGRGVFRGPFADGTRFARHFAHLARPWRRQAGYALLIGQVPGDASLAGVDINGWYIRTASEIRAAGQDARFRPHPVAVERGWRRVIPGAPTLDGDLGTALAGAACVVAWNSNTAVESVLAGVPTVTMDEGSMAWPVTGHSIGEMATPDRAAWAHRLAWCQWTLDELRSGECWAAVGGGAMRAGRLDRKITIQRKTVTLEYSGQATETWADLVANRWAAVMPLGGDERFAIPEISAKQQVEFRVRWSSNVAGLTPQDRIVYPAPADTSPPTPILDTSIYDVAAVHEIGRREGLRIIAIRRTDT